MHCCDKQQVYSHASLNENCDNVIACFCRNSLILQTYNYRGNKKYVLFLVQCHNGIITNSINLFLRVTLCFDSCKIKQIYLIHYNRIVILDLNQNLIYWAHFAILALPAVSRVTPHSLFLSRSSQRARTIVAMYCSAGFFSQRKPCKVQWMPCR